MNKFDHWVNKPRYENLDIFSSELLALIEEFWEMANQTKLNAIENAHSKTLVDKQLGETYLLAQQSFDDIEKHFHQLRIAEYKDIHPEIANMMRSKITKYVSKNRDYAKNMNLIIPDGEDLTIYQIYYNQVLTKSLRPLIESLVKKGKSK